jgi:hypothetical protein
MKQLMAENEELIIALRKELHIELAEKISFEEIKEKLAAYINHLIIDDFQQLLLLLYKVDVNESKLRSVLKENKNDDAGNIISQLIIERQLQKIKTRKEFSQKKNDDGNEEKW